MYKSLRKIYHEKPNDYEQEYLRRIWSNSTVKLNIDQKGYQMFFVVRPEILDNIYEIMKLNTKINMLLAHIPEIGIDEYRK